MIYAVLESHVREAADKAENINADGTINWNYVDADCYMSGTPKLFANDEMYYEAFDEIVNNYVAEMREESAAEHQLELAV